MSNPFQLVDFENERSKEAEDLIKLAGKEQVAVDPGVYSGLPEQTTDVKQPELLWASLAMADGLLRSALQARISKIQNFETQMPRTGSAAAGAFNGLVEVPMHLEFTALASNAEELIYSLPSRSEELRAAGWTNAPAEKPPLFIERLIMRKESADKPDEVHVLMQVVGFAMREPAQPMD